MVEKVVLDWLRAQLSVPVYMETPQTPPGEYVLLEKTGSGITNYIDRATLAIQSISSASLYRAGQINEMVKAAMDGIPARPEVFRAKRNTDYNFTDTRTKQYRYQAIYDMTYKEDIDGK